MGSELRLRRSIPVAGLAAVLMFVAAVLPAAEAGAEERIARSPDNPWYWQYGGRPVLLLGGSNQDNPFNHPDLDGDLEESLDRLAAAGGNTTRNTMSSRDAGNVFPFSRGEDGRFDLAQWNAEYWDRFERFLRWTHAREIIVQIEIWDPWDYHHDHYDQGGWSRSPFNPEKNVNYTAAETGLPTAIDYPPAERPTEHSFFHTVPELEDNGVVLRWQEAFVAKILEHALEYPHVLYCTGNEMGEPVEWDAYWARFVLAKAAEQDMAVEVTAMRRNSNITAADHRYIYQRPQTFTFLDIAQNNAVSGPLQGRRILEVRNYLAAIDGGPRPLNNNKIYHASDEALHRFWRIVFCGGASARFHRPRPASMLGGWGLSAESERALRAARQVEAAFDFFTAEPRPDLVRSEGEAWLLAQPGQQYAVYLPEGSPAELSLEGDAARWTVRWLNLDDLTWHDGPTAAAPTAEIRPPASGAWIGVVTAANR